MILRGTILAGDDLTPMKGYLEIDSGRIEKVEDDKNADSKKIILPAFINCHTHVGDYIFKDRGIDLPLDKLVKSPDGLKHQLLSSAGDQDLMEGIRGAEDEMGNSGTTTFVDFREQGLRGIRIFKRALRNIRGLALGRPKPGSMGAEVVREIANEAHGFGLDRVGAYQRRELELMAPYASSKMVAVHVSEGRWKRREIDTALDVLSANILIHLTHARKEDLARISDRGVRAVVCPRCNLHLGVGLPPIDDLIEQGVVTGLGTDNAMINSLTMFREMEVALAVSRRVGPRDILKMATIGGARVAGISEETGTIETGKKADIMVLEPGYGLKFTRDIHAAVVKRAGPKDVSMVMREGKVLA